MIEENILKKNKGNLITFTIIYCVVFAFTVTYFYPHFSIDSFYTQYNLIMSAKQVLSLGRILTALTFYLLDKTHISIIDSQLIFTLLSTIIIAFAIQLLYKVLLKTISDKKYRDRKIIRAIILISCFLTILNPFFTEHFAFSELTFFSSLALLMIVSSLYILYYAKRLSQYLMVYFCLFISLSLYQSWIALFPAIGLLLLVLKENIYNLKSFFINSFKIFGVYFAATFTNLFVIRYLVPIFYLPTKRFDNVNILENLKAIIKIQHSIWIDGLSVLPREMLLLLVVTGLVIFFTSLRFASKKIGLMGTSILALFYLIIFSFGPIVITHPIWVVPRIIVGLGGVVGIILFLQILFINNRKKQISAEEVKNFLYIPFVFGLIVMSIYMFQYHRIAKDELLANEIDKKEILDFYNTIEIYEHKTGLTVKKVAFVEDNNPMPCYVNTICSGDLNVRILSVQWGRIPSFEYYTGRKFQETEINTEIYKKYFQSKDYNSFEPGQIIITGDTANILVY